MRDEYEYETMSPVDLRAHLVRVSKELASWSFALEQAKRDHNLAYTNALTHGYKSIAEARAQADIEAAENQREIFDAAAYVRFYETIRDCIVTLLAGTVIDNSGRPLAG